MLINSCIDSVGMKGVCGETTYPFYIDSIGISLNKAAKLADSAFITGKELFEESKALAFLALKSDISIDGMKMAAAERFSTSYERDINISTPHTYTVTKNRDCHLQAICIENIGVRIKGKANVKISIVSHDTYIIYYALVEDKAISAAVNKCFNSDSLDIVVEVTPIVDGLKTTATIGIGDDAAGFIYSGKIECSFDLLICSLPSLWAMALMYKTAALMLNNILFNDRYNDVIAYQKDGIKARIGQLDSSMNILPKEVTPFNEGGLYQKEVEKINKQLVKVAKDSKCTCCFECDGIPTAKIAIP